MAKKRQPMSEQERAKVLAELRSDVRRRSESYRGRALQLFPHVCGSCAREFSGKRLKELTVHHKDHDHHNNPPDGSNWELLCLYCHDHEHEKLLDAEYIHPEPTSPIPGGPGFASPFESLDVLTDDQQAED